MEKEMEAGISKLKKKKNWKNGKTSYLQKNQKKNLVIEKILRED